MWNHIHNTSTYIIRKPVVNLNANRFETVQRKASQRKANMADFEDAPPIRIVKLSEDATGSTTSPRGRSKQLPMRSQRNTSEAMRSFCIRRACKVRSLRKATSCGTRQFQMLHACFNSSDAFYPVPYYGIEKGIALCKLLNTIYLERIKVAVFDLPFYLPAHMQSASIDTIALWSVFAATWRSGLTSGNWQHLPLLSGLKMSRLRAKH